MDRQAVIVNVPLRGRSDDFADLEELGEQLAECVQTAGVGELDGDLIGQDWGIIYLYGPDADRLWQSIEGLLHAARLPAGAYVVKQHGPPGSSETRIDLLRNSSLIAVSDVPKQRYREGDWFAAPLRDGRYVLGRIARHYRGTVFGYFFAPPFVHVPTLDDTRGRRAEESFTQMLFSHLGLRDGEWPVLGLAGDRDRDAWPLVEFEWRLEIPGRADKLYAVRVEEENLNRRASVTEVDISEAGKRPSESLSGSGAAVVHLEQALAALS
jgi:hypothetical protein